MNVDLGGESENTGQSERHEELPLSLDWRAQLLDCAILGAAVAAGARLPVHPAARMALLVELRRCGLTGESPCIDVLARLDTWLRKIAAPRAGRRMVARHMNVFVGTPWAGTICRVAEAVALASRRGGDPSRETAELIALRGLRTSLGLCAPHECAPGGKTL